MSRIHNDNVHTGFKHQFNTFFRTGAHTNSGTNKKTTMSILGGIGMFTSLDDVFNSHQTSQVEIFINNQHTFHAMLMHEVLSVFKAGAFTHGDQAVSRSHDLRNRNVHARFKTKVTTRYHTENATTVNNR